MAILFVLEAIDRPAGSQYFGSNCGNLDATNVTSGPDMARSFGASGRFDLQFCYRSGKVRLFREKLDSLAGSQLLQRVAGTAPNDAALGETSPGGMNHHGADHQEAHRDKQQTEAAAPALGGGAQAERPMQRQRANSSARQKSAAFAQTDKQSKSRRRRQGSEAEGINSRHPPAIIGGGAKEIFLETSEHRRNRGVPHHG